MRHPDRAADGYVQIPVFELPQLELRHVTSAVDASIAVPKSFAEMSQDVITGFTEWAGVRHGESVTLGWDWGLYRGHIELLSPAEIRTNIQLIAADGVPHSALSTRMRLSEWLALLPWRGTVSSVLGETPPASS
jgi:hypothetical protein